MANITASMVKDLREKTGAGMMDCKKALVESDGDVEKAIDWMKKGAQPSDTVRNILSRQGIMKKFNDEKNVGKEKK